jgi:hypothetical protein
VHAPLRSFKPRGRYETAYYASLRQNERDYEDAINRTANASSGIY